MSPPKNIIMAVININELGSKEVTLLLSMDKTTNTRQNNNTNDEMTSKR